MLLRPPLAYQPFEQKAEADAHAHRQDIDHQRQDDGPGVHPTGGVQTLGDGGADTEGDESHRVIQGHHLQDGVHKGAFGLILPNGHDGGGGGSGAADGPEQQGERNGQMKHADHGQRDQQRRQQRLEQGDDHDAPAAATKGGKLEVFPHAESDESQGRVGDEVHAADHAWGNQTQDIGADENPGEYVAGNVGQLQLLGNPGEQEAAEQHYRQAENHRRVRVGGGQVFQQMFPLLFCKSCLDT